MAINENPSQDKIGKWRVGQKVFDTNAQAWRYIDKANNEPVSRAQDVSDWIAVQIANRGC